MSGHVTSQLFYANVVVAVINHAVYVFIYFSGRGGRHNAVSLDLNLTEQFEKDQTILVYFPE